MEISVIVPVFNEKPNIAPLYDRLHPVLEGIDPAHEILFVDDGSSDGTHQAIEALRVRDARVKYIRFSRNFGHEMANTAGFREARGRTVCIIDGDLQDPPELIRDMYDKYRSGYDIVYAKRKKRHREGPLQRFFAKSFYRILGHLSDVEIPLDTGDFRLLSRRVVDELNRLNEHNRFFRGLTHWVGFHVTHVTFDRDDRHAGETKYNFLKLLKLAFDAILSFSYKPLKIFSAIGLMTSVGSLLMMVYWVFAKLMGHRAVEGWTSIVAIVLFLFGILMLQITLLGEYIARIYEEVKSRPLYIIEKAEGVPLDRRDP